MTAAPAGRTRKPLRKLFAVNRAQRRRQFALRAAFCVAVPVLIGWAAGDIATGLMATIGAFTSPYGSGRPLRQSRSPPRRGPI